MTMPPLGPQEPPQDERLYNRRQPDGTYRPLEGFFFGARTTFIQQTLDPGGQIPYEVAAGVPQQEGVRAYATRTLAALEGAAGGKSGVSVEEMEAYVQELVEEEARGREAEEEAMSRYSAAMTAQARWEDARAWERAQARRETVRRTGRAMRTQREHPSDRLRSGAVRDFEQALVLVDRAHTMEHQLGRDEPAEADIERLEQALAQVRAAIRHAGRVYRAEQEAARLRTVERLRADALAADAALDDEASRWLGLLATALEQGDYSGLAI